MLFLNPSPTWSVAHRSAAEQLAARLNRPICGSYTRKGELCRNRPDASRSNGRCRFHGSRAGRPPTHGRYSKFARAGIEALDVIQPDARLPRIDAGIAAVKSAITKSLGQSDPPLVDVGDAEQWTAEVIRNAQLRALLEKLARLIRERIKLTPSGFVAVDVVAHLIKCREAIIFDAIAKAGVDKDTLNRIRADYARATRPFKDPIFEFLDLLRLGESIKKLSKKERAARYRALTGFLAPADAATDI
jgi:hypothetical protein